ncbi:MAG: IclR family transcriptional regulator C-terminal domain-containing protein [Nocardioidaceae bacterium]
MFLAYAGSLPAGPLPSYTRRTITAVSVLAAEVAAIRERGWAQAVGEREEDLNAIAAPVRGTGGVLTAVLGLQGPAGRFGRKAMLAAVDQLVAHCAELSSTSRRAATQVTLR